MAVTYLEIERLLAGVERRRKRVALGAAVGFGLAGAAACLLAGAGAIALGAGEIARSIALLGLAASVAGALLAFVWMVARTASSSDASARLVGRADPGVHSDLLSSVELARQYQNVTAPGRFSAALVDALVERTAARIAGLDLSRAVPSRPAMQALAAVAAVALVHAVALGVAGKPLAAGYRKLLQGSSVKGVPPPVEPITGDIELVYAYPAYMARQAKTISGTGGEITAPKGTEVRIKTRADRHVDKAQLVIESGTQLATTGTQDKVAMKTVPLQVTGNRALAGSIVVEEGGRYRFRYQNASGRAVAEGPAIPIAVEPDAFPEVKILTPAHEVEVDAKARVNIEWSASDDYGLAELVMVLKIPGVGEQSRPLRKFDSTRREGGFFELDLGPLRLAEGERIHYYLQVNDNDAVSGPKRGASATQIIKIYSEAEHHRAALERAQALWEKLINLTGDRIEFSVRQEGKPWSPERLASGEAFDARTRQLHEEMREAAAALRKDTAAPKELAAALANVSSGIREIEQRLTGVRGNLARSQKLGRGAEGIYVQRVEQLDGDLTREMEKDILYLENLFDKRKALDLVQLAKDLASRRRELSSLLEKYKSSPNEETKKQLLAEISRMKGRMNEMMKRMAELAKGINDEHMNAEALAELRKSKNMSQGLDDIEQMLAKGDVDGALKALDSLGNQMQEMLSQLQKTAGEPDKKNAELLKDMLAFKKELEGVQGEQQKLADETDRIKSEYKKRLKDKLKQSAESVNRMRKLTEEARVELQDAEKGVSAREEDEYAQARDRLQDLDRALAMKDFEAALDMAQRALPAMQRLTMDLEDEANIAERYSSIAQRDPKTIREAQKHANKALPPASKVRDELQKMFPDPRTVLGKGEQQQLDKLAQRQQELQRRAGGLQQQLDGLIQKAPVFPQSASQMIGESRGHMQQASGELSAKNPQKGHGQQRRALDALGRLRRGLDEMAKNQQGGGAGGFPFPFGDGEGGQQQEDGSSGDPTQQKVEIPGAEAYKVPEEFRKDLLDAMKQGSPEVYKGEVQRYYEELVR